ncbi:MAG: L-2-hydroxyglutarate oxidase LhgO [Ignavibacteriaceae bacterium]|nr:L-2-hydroxyglutarate oxidase LhgO [Ignavibacteriaceae bacterium]
MTYDITIIGGGIVGTATGMAILKKKPCKLLILEAEDVLAAHQTGHNSGVIHSGLYYKPGSLKAQNCTTGRELLYQFCEEQAIPHQRCGKVVVATSKEEIPALNELERKGTLNGLTGMKRLKKEEIKEYEPHTEGIGALYIPQTGIVNYTKVTEAYGKIIQQLGGEIRTSNKVKGISSRNNQITIETTGGTYSTKLLVNCAGLYSDRVARMCGIDPELLIIPFRGEYYELVKEKEYLVKNLIYPVPDPRFPFLGVHFTRMIHGGIEAGPNAVLAFRREGYSKTDVSLYDTGELLLYKGFWKMAGMYYKMGWEEMKRSFSKELFVRALQKLIPEIKEEDVKRGGAGVRAQALDKKGKLLDDFCIKETVNMVHVLNAPSPAATASIAIGEKISDIVMKHH